MPDHDQTVLTTSYCRSSLIRVCTMHHSITMFFTLHCLVKKVFFIIRLKFNLTQSCSVQICILKRELLCNFERINPISHFSDKYFMGYAICTNITQAFS